MERNMMSPGFGASYALGCASQPYRYRAQTGDRANAGGQRMEPQEVVESAAERSGLALQEGHRPCPTCGDGSETGAGDAYTPTPVYALGRVEAHFPSLGVEKEFAQAGARSGAAGTDAEVTKKALQEHRYLARQVCWVFRISGMETYLLRPRDPADFALLIEAVREDPASTDMDLVIGWLGRGHATCGMYTLPVVTFDQLYSFDRASLLNSIPRPATEGGEKYDQEADAAFNRTAAEVLERTAMMIDNAGATDEHRALNYLAVRFDGIYKRTAQAHNENQRLRDISVEPAPVSSTRKILDVILTYADRTTDVPDYCFVRVDVEEEFPFLVGPLKQYFRR
jgi:hypothetical protein